MSQNSNLFANDTSFDWNKGLNGGAIFPSCLGVCSFAYYRVNFTNNIAQLKGGAYYYPEWRPIFEDIYFENNSAAYGINIGSLPIKIFIND